MALDYSKFRSSAVDDGLFDLAPFDREAGRKTLIRRIERAGKQLRKEQSAAGGRDFEVGHHNQIRLRLTLNGQRIYVESDREDYFPLSSNDFTAFEAEFIKQVNAGEYDEQIESALSAAGSATLSASKAAAKTKGGGFPKDQCSYWESLSSGDRKGVGRLWGVGKNPDGSSRAEVGDKPNAPYAGSSKKKK